MNDEGQGNPNWKTILDKLPESLHSLIKPELEAWDKGVTEKIQSVRDGYKDYEKYKPFVDGNVDPGYIDQSLRLVHEINNNTEEIVSQIIDTYKLDYVSKEEAERQASEGLGMSDSSFDFGSDDIQDHPQFKKLNSSLEELQNKFNSRDQQDEDAQAVEEFQQYLRELKEKRPDIDTELITAYMANGASEQQAISAHDTFVAKYVVPGSNQQNPQDNGSDQGDSASPPVVMGGAGGAGSGSPQESVDFGKMSASQVSDYVEALAAQSSNNSQ